MSLITVIGRGHSGTRAISHTLSASGVYMGEPLNESGDLLPPQAMYDACRVLAQQVRHVGGLQWDWSALHQNAIDPQFTDLIAEYLATVHASDAPHKGWKIPETTLCFPWVARLFPQAKYIFWIRDPRDCIIGGHITDDLRDFDIPYPETDDLRLRRAVSWKYQYDLVRATPLPAQWIEVRFEDFVLKQEETLQRLEQFLEIPLARIPVRPETIGRWKSDAQAHDFDFFAEALSRYGYEPLAAPHSASFKKAPTRKPRKSTKKQTIKESTMKLRTAIIGMGPIGNRHADMYRQTALAELVGVCDILPERAEAAGARLGVPHYLDAAEMLAALKPDLVSITTAGVENGGDHYTPAMQAIEAGCHVLCEKPISNEIPKAEAMVAAARRKGVTLGTDMNHRFNPAHRMAKQWVEEGRLGTLLFMNMSMWIKNPQESSPFYMIQALNPHTVDIMRYFCGEITQVHCFATTAPGRTIYTTAAMSMRFASGAVGTLTCSYDIERGHPMERCEVGGTGGRFVIEDMFQEVTLYPAGDLQKIVYTNPIFGGMYGFEDTFKDRIHRFVAEVAAGTPADEIDGTGADGLAAQRVLAAAIQSIQTGKVIEVAT